MAEITAKLVAELRERTGAGMMDCKKALVATAGDIDAAAEKMRMDGMVKADKKASRVAAEGRIAVATGTDAIALVEVNSETDFVAKADDFVALADAAAKLALANKPGSVEDLVALKDGDATLEEKRRALVEIETRHDAPQKWQRWTPDQDAELIRMRREGMPLQQIADHFDRNPDSVRDRLKRVGGR